MVRLTPSAPAGHSAAPAVPMPIKDASKTYAAKVLRMPPFQPRLLDRARKYAQDDGETPHPTQTLGGGNLMAS